MRIKKHGKFLAGERQPSKANKRVDPDRRRHSVQGKNQLITHFQNSSLLHEDKRCRPILFKSDAEFAGEQEPFPTSTAGRTHRARPFPTGPDGA